MTNQIPRLGKSAPLFEGDVVRFDYRKKEIFFDSIEVRSCIAEIRNSRTVINRIALRLQSLDNNKLNQGEIDNAEKDRKEESI